VHEALQRLEREIIVARGEKHALLKVIHGYGSTGAGGDIRIAVQKRLREFVEARQILECIFGENWSKSDEITWKLLKEHPELKGDPHMGRQNRGITVIVL
jgi:hypothetical protein